MAGVGVDDCDAWIELPERCIFITRQHGGGGRDRRDEDDGAPTCNESPPAPPCSRYARCGGLFAVERGVLAE